jgi:hypothetical protein
MKHFSVPDQQVKGSREVETIFLFAAALLETYSV